ncbi:hypothetical protein CHS0354_040294, partial [Potamilus streckersoni]
KKPVEVTLTGTQYLTYDLNAQGSQIFSNKDQLSLHFRTQHPDGLLFFTGEGKDFMTVFLMNGAIAVAIDLGSGAYSTITDLNGYKLDDNHWHHLVVHRESREITIQIDGLIRATGSTEGKFTMLSSSILYVGGSSSTRTLPGSRISSNFKGCLKQVQYSADNIKFDLTELAKTGHRLIRVVGEIQFGRCQEEVQTQPITFTSPKSFIALPRWELRKEFGTIAFRFKTTEPTGLIIYNSDRYDVSKRDFFALEIVDGYFYLVLELGSGVTKVKASRTRVDDGKEHDVLFQYRGQEGYINIDGDRTDYSSPGNSKQLDLMELLYVGGVDFERLGAHRMPKEVWSGTLGYGYVGCFQDLVINNVRIDLLSLAIKQGQKGVADQCRTREDHCGSRPCLHNGICQEGWNRYMCKCAGTAYTGSNCQDAAVTLKFDGVQHMKINYPEELETEIEDISLRFHTIRSDAILLLTASEIYPDMYEVYLEGGTVKVTINLGNRAKTLIIGQGLNDDQWHTVYIQRRGQDIQINMDDNRPVLDVIPSIVTTLHVSTILLGSVGPMLSDDLAASAQTSDFNLVDAGIKVQNDNQIRHHKGFVGAMQNFIWNGQQYFEIAKQGRVQDLEMTARYDDGESVILDPVTFKSTASYVVLPQLQADSYFSVCFKFKTLGPNGLILFNGISDYDYLALELHNGYLYYSYDVGGGSQRIYVNTAEPLNDNKWHDVSLIRPMKEKQIIRVDSFPATVENMDRNSPTEFNLKGPLYLGGVQKTMYISLPANIKSGHGFQGCMATLDINGHKYNILRDAINVEYSVTVGCKESGISCQPSSCFNGGRCVQQWNSYICDCEMTSYTGPTCSDVSSTYRFAMGKGLITFEYGEGKDVSTNSDYLAFGFKTIQHNANLVRVDSSGGDDYIEMQLAGGNLVVAYNMGKLEHPIGEFYHMVNDGAYHVVRFTRSGPNATLQIDNWPQQTKTPAGDQMSVFNNQARVWIGGRKDSRGQINNGFIGTMSGFVFNGHHIFDLLANGDPQVTKEGDVTLLLHNKSKMENDPEAMQSTQGIKTTPTQLTSDDIISSSGMGPECFKQEDEECISEASAPTDEIITASIIVHRTTTLRPDLNQSQDISIEPCDDEDKECPITGDKGQGKLTTSVSPTDTHSPEQAREKKSGTGEINIALIIGVTAGVVVALIILLVALYKFRSREEGSYKVDESQNFAYLESKKQPSNGALVNHNGSGKKKDVKEWYV